MSSHGTDLATPETAGSEGGKGCTSSHCDRDVNECSVSQSTAEADRENVEGVSSSSSSFKQQCSLTGVQHQNETASVSSSTEDSTVRQGRSNRAAAGSSGTAVLSHRVQVNENGEASGTAVLSDSHRTELHENGGDSCTVSSCEELVERESNHGEAQTVNRDLLNISDVNQDDPTETGTEASADGCGDGRNTDNREASEEVLADENKDIEDGNEDDNEPSIADEQHDLSGPHRRHQAARRQRRQGVIVPPQLRRRIQLPDSLMAQWRQIGNEWGLQDDDDIARVLVRHYEDVVAGRPPRPPPRPRCEGCGEILVPLPCEACGPNHHTSRLTHDWDHRGSGGGGGGGGRGGFCGRCRD